MLRHQRNMKRIKKESLKNMMAEPLLHDEKSELGELCDKCFPMQAEKKCSFTHKESGFGIHKLSGYYEKGDWSVKHHKQSGVMTCNYNSDEDSK